MLVMVAKHRHTIDTGLDIGCSSVFLDQHGIQPGKLVLQPKGFVEQSSSTTTKRFSGKRNDQTDQGSTSAAGLS